jgi:hypothetical protein
MEHKETDRNTKRHDPSCLRQEAKQGHEKVTTDFVEDDDFIFPSFFFLHVQTILKSSLLYFSDEKKK